MIEQMRKAGQLSPNPDTDRAEPTDVTQPDRTRAFAVPPPPPPPPSANIEDPAATQIMQPGVAKTTSI